MKLQNVVPWGRSLEEYCAMFSLSDGDLQKSILGCSDGPASFSAELAERGGAAVSVDPIYGFSAQEIRARIEEVYPLVMEQVVATREDFLWDSIGSPEALGQLRMNAMNRFLDEYETGSDRYVEGSLPQLPFEHKQFELALCSHFLFLYSQQFDYQFHEESLVELCRVASEVRIYPLVDLENQRSPYVDRFVENADRVGITCEERGVPYRFQRRADTMLVLKQSK